MNIHDMNVYIVHTYIITYIYIYLFVQLACWMPNILDLYIQMRIHTNLHTSGIYIIILCLYLDMHTCLQPPLDDGTYLMICTTPTYILRYIWSATSPKFGGLVREIFLFQKKT